MIITMASLPLMLHANDKAIKFLGIPVDGYKSEMIQNLREKGFKHSVIDGEDVLEGEFNGSDVNIYIATYNNKVWRIGVVDAMPRDEYQIKLRFNKLCEQFERNIRYSSLSDDQTIPIDEDISYEMYVNEKRYEATFFQKPDNPNLKSGIEELMLELNKLSTNQTDSLTTKQQIEFFVQIFSVLSAYDEDTFSKYDKDFFSEYVVEDELVRAAKLLLMKVDIMSILTKRTVWFTINEHAGEYYIFMFYDNGYNEASGEDL